MTTTPLPSTPSMTPLPAEKIAAVIFSVFKVGEAAFRVIFRMRSGAAALWVFRAMTWALRIAPRPGVQQAAFGADGPARAELRVVKLQPVSKM